MKRCLIIILMLGGFALAASSGGEALAQGGSLCGNGLVDRPAEQCDPNASEYYGTKFDGCRQGQVCKGCRCIKKRKVMRFRLRRPAAPTTTAQPGRIALRRRVRVPTTAPLATAQRNLCGNRRIDPGEECDRPLMTGEPVNECYDRQARYRKICGRDCKCHRSSCGDGYITRTFGEHCDPKAKPIGCGQNQTCSPMCKCIFMVQPRTPYIPGR